jgi:uncharacterized UBP type Zn finger protein
VKDCSYCSFKEEMDISEYAINERLEKTYGKELKEEVNDIGADSVGPLNLNETKLNKTNQPLLKIFIKSDPSIKHSFPFDGRYVLYGVVVHAGSSSGGHYCTYIRKDSSMWWYFDDLKVKEVKWEEFVFIFAYFFICY